MPELSLKIPTLTREGDYQAWSNQIRAFLITERRLDRYLDASPAEDDAEGKGRDLLCKARLQLHVAGPLQTIVARATTAKEAWDSLYEDYRGTLRTRQPQLTAKLTELSQGKDSVSAYIDRLLDLRDQFEALDMSSSLPLLSSQFIRGLRDDLRMACAPTLHNVMEHTENTIDDIARELKSLALLLPASATGKSSSGTVHPTYGGKTSNPAAKGLLIRISFSAISATGRDTPQRNAANSRHTKLNARSQALANLALQRISQPR